jgi:hypothetical protein
MHKRAQGKAVLAYTDFCHFNAYLFHGGRCFEPPRLTKSQLMILRTRLC